VFVRASGIIIIFFRGGIFNFDGVTKTTEKPSLFRQNAASINFDSILIILDCT
jgi:hypothetical protein